MTHTQAYTGQPQQCEPGEEAAVLPGLTESQRARSCFLLQTVTTACFSYQTHVSTDSAEQTHTVLLKVSQWCSPRNERAVSALRFNDYSAQ